MVAAAHSVFMRDEGVHHSGPAEDLFPCWRNEYLKNNNLMVEVFIWTFIVGFGVIFRKQFPTANKVIQAQSSIVLSSESLRRPSIVNNSLLFW